VLILSLRNLRAFQHSNQYRLDAAIFDRMLQFFGTVQKRRKSPVTYHPSKPKERTEYRERIRNRARLGLGARFDGARPGCYDRSAGWSSLVARWAHNPKVGGSNPPPATNFIRVLRAPIIRRLSLLSVSCPCYIRQPRDLLEPWLVLLYIFTSLWMAVLLHDSQQAGPHDSLYASPDPVCNDPFPVLHRIGLVEWSG
jgi:hypothetical protein